MAQRVKHLPAAWETWVRSLSQEDPLQKDMATHSTIPAWRIPWTEEPGGLYTVLGVAKSQTRLSNLPSLSKPLGCLHRSALPWCVLRLLPKVCFCCFFTQKADSYCKTRQLKDPCQREALSESPQGSFRPSLLGAPTCRGLLPEGAETP